MAEEQQRIDIAQLSVEELAKVKGQIDEELQFLGNSYTQLKGAQARLMDSMNSLNSVKKENEGTPMLVPLTSSLYVQGQMGSADAVLVDVGTGYYVEKPVPGAQAVLQRRVDVVKENCDKIQQAMVAKKKNQETILMILQQKVAAQQKAASKK